MIDGVDGFGSAFDGKDKSFGLEFGFQRRDEGSDIRFPLRFLGIELVRDIFIGVLIEELERQVLHFRFYLIQTQTMRHGSM